GGPDFKFVSSVHGQEYYVEANRREPLRPRAEKDVVWDAIDEKSAKVEPVEGQRHTQWEPCLLAVDITSLDLPTTREGLLPALHRLGTCGEHIYQAYKDTVFNDRLRLCTDALGVAAVRVASLRNRGFGVAGVLLTRLQYLQIDATATGQAEGAVLVLHKDFENRIPSCIARHVYLVDDACVPAHLA
ncbi:MAG: hypothetical protein ACHQ2Z_03450, partial [Elusimicrobiota bacterium]